MRSARFTCGLVGDIMLGRTFNNIFIRDPKFNPWGNTKKLTKSLDFFMGNLETTLSDVHTKWQPKIFNYQLNPKFAPVLCEAGLDYLSLANNHILDYRNAGMNQTINTLDALKCDHFHSRGIQYSGVGHTLAEASDPAIISSAKLNRPILIYSAADHYDYWQVGNPDSPNKGLEGLWLLEKEFGTGNYNIKPIVERIQKDTKKYSKKPFIILSLHWGSNYEPIISPEKQKLANDLLSNDIVHIIHGHSAHHVQPIEEINGNYCFYSCGDFVDDYAIDKVYRNDLAFLAKFDIDTQNAKIRDLNILPTRISDYQVNFLDKQDPDFKWVKNAIS